MTNNFIGDKYMITIIDDAKYTINTKDFFRYLKFSQANRDLSVRTCLILLNMKFLEEPLDE